MSKKLFVVLAILVAVLLSGCYINDDVNTDQVGAQLHKNKIVNCVGPGVYTDMGWFADLREVSVATLTFEVEDKEVATKDNQLVGVRITVQARRKGDCESVSAFLTNWSRLLNDDVLKETIDATAREGIKNGTRAFTLQQLLDDRNGLANGISEQLKADAGKYSTDIINVTIENVEIAPEYADTLQKTAQLKAEEDYQERRQSLIEQQASTDLFERQQQQKVLDEQVKVEQKQTAVDIEIASREGKKIAAQYEVYKTNEQAFKLRQLELLREILGDKATMWFLQPGTDLTLLLSQLNGNTIPVPVPTGETQP